MTEDKKELRTPDPKTAADPAQRRRYVRMREVEELYLNGYSASEILTILGDRFNVVYGTIRNDIVAVRKRWRGELEPKVTDGAAERYLGGIKSLRRKALSGWKEQTFSGETRVKGRDYKLVFELDKEIARLSGVSLKSDEKALKITIEKAKAYIDDVLDVIFDIVTDQDQRQQIAERLEILDSKDSCE